MKRHVWWTMKSTAIRMLRGGKWSMRELRSVEDVGVEEVTANGRHPQGQRDRRFGCMQ